jgi:hypothetical protein
MTTPDGPKVELVRFSADRRKTAPTKFDEKPMLWTSESEKSWH